MLSSSEFTVCCNLPFSVVIASLFSPMVVVLSDIFVLSGVSGVITKFDII